MITFLAISSFSNRIKSLMKVKRGIYINVSEEIKSEFAGKSIVDIRNNRDMILLSDEAIVIKLRLPDKKHKLAKKDGYRLIYLVSKKTENVVFLDIYPKRGPLQHITISDAILTQLLVQFSEEASAGTLEVFPIETVKL